MFQLAGSSYPKSSEELAASLHQGLGEVLTFPPGHVAVAIQGGAFPTLSHVAIKLTDASIKSKTPPQPPKPVGERTPGVIVAQLDVIGKPIRYQGRGLNFELNATHAKFDFAHDAGGRAMLVAKDADSGHVAMDIANDDLQFILKAVATEAAKQHGATIQDLDVRLTATGPRTVDTQVRVKAKKMMMSGTVTLRGRADIDDNLTATLSNLACTGEGMMGNMAAGMAQGMLKQWDGRKFPLSTFSLGGLALRDLNISTDAGLKITADVGKA